MFRARYLAAGLHAAKNPVAIRRLMEPLYEISPGIKGTTRYGPPIRRFSLRTEVAEVVEHTLYDDAPCGAVVEWERWSDVQDFTNLPEYPTHHQYRTDLQLRKLIPLGVATVDGALRAIGERITREGETATLGQSDDMTLRAARRVLLVVRKWCVSVGGLPNLHQPERNGALSPVGLHIGTLPSPIRRLLFQGSGLSEYRIVGLPWCIIQNAAQSLGVATPSLDAYVTNQPAWHARWAHLTHTPDPAVFSRITSSWLFGGRLSGSLRTMAGRVLGGGGVRALAGDPEIQALRQEVWTVMAQLVRIAAPGWQRNRRTPVSNVVGQVYRLNGRVGRPGAGLRYHLYSGLVEWCVRLASREARNVVSLVPDGFICSTTDPESWSEAVARESRETLSVRLVVRFSATPL